ncbi:ATP-binding protein [Stenotrophomonas geniculata]|uniref:ATP-binding protein n=1 Tax=Stenotrophomonas geniculata TaxID=86188 RepID=A0AAP5F2Z8_9GAMM|nr:ATP-binding protein [Stenotrophomonas geniculata]MDP4309176.1 ATP-binding protein [Stenotrophomonas geniculata]MDQ7952559.1 ATP-binding protein [Stenotrophomonas geniculata]
MTNRYPPANYIRRVEIDELFGETSVKLVAPWMSDPRILVLYGDNGTGKTTILNIIRSLISSEAAGGHRSRLSEIPFSRACVHLEGGGCIEARKKDGLTGPYDLSVRASSESESVHFYVKLRNGQIQHEYMGKDGRDKFNSLLSEIESIIPSVVYLDDKRTFSGSPRQSRSVSRSVVDGRLVRSVDEGEGRGDDPVTQCIDELTNAVRREAFFLSNRGNRDAQSIYTDLVKGITSFPESKVDDSIFEVRSVLEKLEEKSNYFSRYGLAAKIDHREMIEALEDSPEWQRVFVNSLVGPYVKTLSARLGAVEALHRKIDVWVNSLNDFMVSKSFAFSVGEGAVISSASGRKLFAPSLSSGERHLILLLTKAFLLGTKGGVMIVDEPELSLNSSWQRRLIGSLLDMFAGGGCQLIVASHSLEICSQYENQIMELRDEWGTEETAW